MYTILKTIGSKYTQYYTYYIYNINNITQNRATIYKILYIKGTKYTNISFIYICSAVAMTYRGSLVFIGFKFFSEKVNTILTYLVPHRAYSTL